MRGEDGDLGQARVQLARGGLQGEQHSVSGRVALKDHAIMVPGDHGIIEDGDGADWCLSLFSTPAGLGDRLGHEELVIHRSSKGRSGTLAASPESTRGPAQILLRDLLYCLRTYSDRLMTAKPPTTSRLRAVRRLRVPRALLPLAAVFAGALLVPMPATDNTARAEVVAQVEGRLPGWSIVHTRASWEGAWSVVAACGPQRLGFQLVPGHGLSPGDAWLHPEDQYARSRLATISDDFRYLVWFGKPAKMRSLSCQQELARTHGMRGHGTLD
jgi:hypothetical protein